MPNKTQQEPATDPRQIDLVDNPPERREAPRSMALESMAQPHPTFHAPAPSHSAAVTPVELVRLAVQSGANMDQLERLMDMQLKYEANEARKAFVADMAEFKKNPPQIVKDKLVGYENKDGSFTGYKHASLGNVTNAVVEGLAQHGFSHRWDIEQDGIKAKVTCTITHRMGHSESVAMEAAKDDSGKKNAIQQVASSITYLQRYTLLAATGLATHDQADDDGQAAGVDVALADKWLLQADSATTIDELKKAWKDGLAEIRAASDTHAYNELKARVEARTAEFHAAAGGAA